jgi:hypothetical protein
MERREFLLSAGGIVGATAIGSVAYTSATVKRSVTADIAADSQAIIGLNAGTHAAIYEKGNGRLVIDTSGVADSTGVNSRGTFRYGSTAHPVSTYAFSITNNDSNPHGLTVSLSNMELPGNSWFKLDFYDTNGDSLGTASPNQQFSYSNWGSGETIYAIIAIDTAGTNKADTISGDMVFDAA